MKRVAGNDGAAQPSLATGVTVTFSSLVGFMGNPANVFRVTGPLGPVGLNAALAQDATGARTVVTLTFTGSDIVNGSLADGRYTLTIDGNSIVDASRAAVDGDVDATNLTAFAGTLDRQSGQAGYLPFFDYDGNGFVGVIDMLQFALRLGREV